MSTYVVWWTYEANYSPPEIVGLADSHEQAFNMAFPQYARTHHEGFMKYAVKVESLYDLKLIP